jgi:hypothetical protein
MPAKKLKVLKVKKANKDGNTPKLPEISVPDGQKKLYQLKTPFKKAICGDLFGTTSNGETSMLGMLYRARVQNNSKEKQLFDKKLETVDGNFLKII